MMFEGIRKSCIGILIASVVIFTIVAILGIWEIIAGEFTGKSLGSIIVIATIALLILIVSLERDKKWVFSPEHKQRQGSSFSVLRVLGLGFLAFVFLSFIFGIFTLFFF